MHSKNSNDASPEEFSIIRTRTRSRSRSRSNSEGMTPKWQRFYERGSRRMEQLVTTTKVSTCTIATQTDDLQESGLRGEANGECLQPTRALTALEQQNLPEIKNWKNAPIFCRFNVDNHLEVSERGERAFLEDEHTRDEVRGIATDGYIHPSTTKLTLFHPLGAKVKKKLTPNTPVVRMGTGTGVQRSGIPINVLGKMGFVPFETKLFKGKFSLAVADLEDSEMAHIFRGKKRRYRYVVVGKFKEEIRMDQVFTGQIIREINNSKR